MKSWDKEVEQSLLNDEKVVIQNLEKCYKSALSEIDNKIGGFTVRVLSNDNPQSAIYQMRYQQELKKQVESALKDLQNNNYSTINDYLQGAYTNSFLGAQYALHNQGVPLITPINRQSMIQALTLNSQISEGLYSRLGVDVDRFKRTITSEVSRGIATGSSWNQIAKQISNKGNVTYSNASRIVRTEGHRIQNEAKIDAFSEAKKKGADIVKQWDSTLDGNTRDTHRRLDGQIRELDEDFEIDGMTASAPGHFGDPAEDCNCRCCLLQRARWALDGDELKTLQDRAEYFGLDKTKDFEDFKEKYLDAAKELKNSQKGDIIKNISSVADCQTFDDMVAYLSDTYGIAVDDSVKKLDFTTVQQSMTGIEQVMQEFPKAQSTLKSIGTSKDGVMCASFNGNINFNPEYYKDGNASVSTLMVQGNTTGFHPANTGVLETGSHEMGHLLERTLIEMNNPETDVMSMLYKSESWSKCTEAKSIISQACKMVKKTEEGKGLTNSQLKAMVSGYATKDDSECLAECVADYVANGENASILSKEVWSILKGKLG